MLTIIINEGGAAIERGFKRKTVELNGFAALGKGIVIGRKSYFSSITKSGAQQPLK